MLQSLTGFDLASTAGLQNRFPLQVKYSTGMVHLWLAKGSSFGVDVKSVCSNGVASVQRLVRVGRALGSVWATVVSSNTIQGT